MKSKARTAFPVFPAPRRTGGQLPRLASLTPAQRRALIKWLTVEELPYAECVRRLRDQFGLVTSSGSLSKFYHSLVPGKASTSYRPPVLDLVIVQRGNKSRIMLFRRSLDVKPWHLSPKGLEAIRFASIKLLAAVPAA